MYRIRDELNQPRGEATTISAAEIMLDRLCAEAAAQAGRNLEGTREQWHRFDVVDDDGEVVMFRQHSPDPDQPYVPLNEEDA